MYHVAPTFQAEKLPWACSKGLTFVQASGLMTPSRYFIPGVPPRRPAVVVSQMPRSSCAMGHQVVALKGFFAAEDYHQDFMAKHPEHPYIVYHDIPKVAHLKEMFPQYYREPAKTN